MKPVVLLLCFFSYLSLFADENASGTEPFRFRQIDIRLAANRGFSDEFPSDGKGSWNDQGPDNDLSMLAPGGLGVCDGRVEFEILDESVNGGKSCLALSGTQTAYPKEIAVDTPNAAGNCLYLLTSMAWAPGSHIQTGEVEAVFGDGSSQVLPVMGEEHVGNWWNPCDLSQAVVAWNAANAESVVGIYLTQFQFRDTPHTVIFRMNPDLSAVWCIAAAGTGSEMLNLTKQETPHYYVEGKDWVRLDFDAMTEPGTILDFSKYTEKPAGKYGQLEIDEQGHFYFHDAPGKRVRFFGPNFVANYLPEAEQERVIKQITRMGYNIVRFHHFERELQDPRLKNSTELEKSHLDVLDKFFARLKENGIYVTLDLYASRQFKAEDGIVERESWKDETDDGDMKKLVFVSESAMENWKTFARNLLTHVNPYTGIAWGDDPALCIINLVNEDPLIYTWYDSRYEHLYQEKYDRYLEKRGLATPENKADRCGLFLQFINELQINGMAEMMRFLKEELHVKAQLTDINCGNNYSLIEPRGTLPMVDYHQYWDHPVCPITPWSLPYRFCNASALQLKAWAPRNIFPQRIFGKPLLSTEFNYCNTNPYRMECGPLMGGYAAFQDWDCLNRFAWTHYYDTVMGISPVSIPKHFDINNDPLGQLDERIIWMLFLRGDVAPADGPKYAFTASPKHLESLGGPISGSAMFPGEFTEMGLFTSIGSLPFGVSLPNTVVLQPMEDPEWKNEVDEETRQAMQTLRDTGCVTSSTGELALNTKAMTFTVDTPRSNVALGKGSLDAGALHVANSTHFSTIALFAMDDAPIESSASLLMFHIPKVGSTMQRFSNASCTLLEDWGHKPLLVERASADIAIDLPGDWTVEALNLNGTPKGAVPAVSEGGVLSFRARTDALPGGVMVYHIHK